MELHWEAAIAGGLLIGLAAVLMMAALGRIAGISGILWSGLTSVFQGGTDNTWRLAFLAGLVIFPLAFHGISGFPIPAPPSGGTLLAIAAGFLVGFGTRMGSGCTSGHGICGISRLSWRSVIATLTFMLAGILSVSFFRQVLGWI